ncbi:MAG: hypothetical protein IPH16_14485 [Haliscomenobacter sp.]|nr:hypothetical protein [Haliscomenobacter sp.]MBK7477951.1 hypothetical protein [Haliscomenobacter sp.]
MNEPNCFLEWYGLELKGLMPQYNNRLENLHIFLKTPLLGWLVRLFFSAKKFDFSCLFHLAPTEQLMEIPLKGKYQDKKAEKRDSLCENEIGWVEHRGAIS